MAWPRWPGPRRVEHLLRPAPCALGGVVCLACQMCAMCECVRIASARTDALPPIPPIPPIPASVCLSDLSASAAELRAASRCRRVAATQPWQPPTHPAAASLGRASTSASRTPDAGLSHPLRMGPQFLPVASPSMLRLSMLAASAWTAAAAFQCSSGPSGPWPMAHGLSAAGGQPGT